MRHIKAICLDLDDTLWDLGPVIGRAETILYEWMGQHYPHVTELYSVEDIRELRGRMASDHLARCHDMSWLRRETYRRMARHAGYSAAMADEAFAVFQAARNQVALFDDVLPALDTLVSSHLLLTLTNGNADLEIIGIARYFEHSFSAEDLGVAKPDPAIFREVSRRSGLPAGDIVHVGDDPHKDVVAARVAGMEAVWVNRRGAEWPDDIGDRGHEIRDLHGLLPLLEQ